MSVCERESVCMCVCVCARAHARVYASFIILVSVPLWTKLNAYTLKTEDVLVA